MPDTSSANKLEALRLELLRIDTLRYENRLHSTTVKCALSLKAVVDLLDETPGFRASGATDTLWSLLTALGDLESGTQSPIFEPVRDSKSGKPPMSTEMQGIMASACVAMDALIRFDKVSADVAAKKVARVMESAKVKLPRSRPGASLAKTVQGWRHRLEEGPGGKAPPFALQAWQLYKSGLAIEQPDVTTGRYLDHLKMIIRSNGLLTNQPT